MVVKVGASFDMTRAQAKLTQIQHGYKAVLMRSSGEMAKQGEEVFKLMMPVDTGSLENAARARSINHKGAGVELRFDINPHARREDKSRRLVVRYAVWLDENRGYELGEKSKAKAAGQRFKVGPNFTGRMKDYANRHFKAKLRTDMANAGFKGRWQ